MPDGTEHRVERLHDAVLSARIEYLRSLFTTYGCGSWGRAQGDQVQRVSLITVNLALDNADEAVALDHILYFCYMGRLRLTATQSFATLLSVMHLADRMRAPACVACAVRAWCSLPVDRMPLSVACAVLSSPAVDNLVTPWGADIVPSCALKYLMHMRADPMVADAATYAALMDVLGDAVEVFARPHLLRLASGLPPELKVAWLASDELRADCEDTVVLVFGTILRTAALAMLPTLGGALLQQAVHAVRRAKLGAWFREAVWSRLDWSHIDSDPREGEEETEVRFGDMVGERVGERVGDRINSPYFASQPRAGGLMLLDATLRLSELAAALRHARVVLRPDHHGTGGVTLAVAVDVQPNRAVLCRSRVHVANGIAATLRIMLVRTASGSVRCCADISASTAPCQRRAFMGPRVLVRAVLSFSCVPSSNNVSYTVDQVVRLVPHNVWQGGGNDDLDRASGDGGLWSLPRWCGLEHPIGAVLWDPLPHLATLQGDALFDEGAWLAAFGTSRRWDAACTITEIASVHDAADVSNSATSRTDLLRTQERHEHDEHDEQQHLLEVDMAHA
jgi:hypothetical protein